jgi:hypothetical protein
MAIISRFEAACLAILVTLVVGNNAVLSLSSSSSSSSKNHLQPVIVGDVNNKEVNISRRNCLSSALGGLICGTALLERSNYRHAAFAEDMLAAEVQSNSAPAERYRTKLLQQIQYNQASEEEILKTIEQLVPYDPSNKAAATFEDDLSGEWKLLWSAKAEAFSPLLKLPRPFKPDSFQYLGQASAIEVGPGRVAQGLTGGLLLGSSQIWLSSGVKAASDDPSVLEISPPFRLEYGGRYQSGQSKALLVEGTANYIWMTNDISSPYTW